MDFTEDKSEAQSALEAISFAFGFGDLNLSFSLASTMDWLASVPGKKTIVLLSTGVDTSLEHSWDLVRRKLETSDIRILAVSLAGDFRRPW